MLDGWYCRTMANEQAATVQNNEDPEVNSSDDDSQEETIQKMRRIDYKEQYSNLKKKFKYLLYENEFLQDTLRSSQRRFLKVTRDRSFLLDRLLQYEKPEFTSSETETESSEDEHSRSEQGRRRKVDNSGNANSSSATRNPNISKRKKPAPKKPIVSHVTGTTPNVTSNIISDGHMTAEEVERHLQSRQSLIELVPERAPPTVPTEMFSNEPSLDSESNDQMVETSPSNIGEDCLSVDMNTIQD